MPSLTYKPFQNLEIKKPETTTAKTENNHKMTTKKVSRRKVTSIRVGDTDVDASNCRAGLHIIAAVGVQMGDTYISRKWTGVYKVSRINIGETVYDTYIMLQLIENSGYDTTKIPRPRMLRLDSLWQTYLPSDLEGPRFDLSDMMQVKIAKELNVFAEQLDNYRNHGMPPRLVAAVEAAVAKVESSKITRVNKPTDFKDIRIVSLDAMLVAELRKFFREDLTEEDLNAYVRALVIEDVAKRQVVANLLSKQEVNNVK